MKARILSLISLFALLLVSTAALSDGFITGIRISRATFGGNNNVEIDVTVTGTYVPWDTFSSTVQLGNRWSSGYPGYYSYNTVWQYASSNFNVPSPYAIDWGDGSRQRFATLFGNSSDGFVGTFSHTYSPGAYTITVGDSVQGRSSGIFGTGNLITGSARYVYCGNGCSPFSGYNTFVLNDPTYTTFGSYILAITANVDVVTGTGIPTTNTYGLIALALLLVGSGLLVYRRPQRFVT